ncbi:hypothetical protein CRD_01835 [Raphidiopsis brookii D9]|nr:hypothetical protein CRD_01835 [Raphidiopsis brookii D9]
MSIFQGSQHLLIELPELTISMAQGELTILFRDYQKAKKQLSELTAENQALLLVKRQHKQPLLGGVIQKGVKPLCLVVSIQW